MNTATHTKEIAEYSATEAGLSELRARLGGIVYAVETTKGMDVAVRDRAEVRGLRVALERKRVELKAPALDFTRRLDSEAKRITALLEEIEAPIDAVIQAELARKEAAKQARVLAEFGRVQAIQDAIGEIHLSVAMVAGKGSAAIQVVADVLTAMPIEQPVFQEMMAQAEEAKRAALAKLILMHGAALNAEAVAAETARERAELAQFRADAAEAKRVDAERAAAVAIEQKAAADKLAADRALFESEKASAAQHLALQRLEMTALADEFAARTERAEALTAPVPVPVETAAQSLAPLARIIAATRLAREHGGRVGMCGDWAFDSIGAVADLIDAAIAERMGAAA